MRSFKNRKILSFLLVIALMVSLFPVDIIVSASNEVDGGTCGDNATWSLNSDGILTISGTGEITAETSESSYPWYEYRDSVTTVVLEDGITNIPRRAFYKFSGLTSVSIPDSVIVIGNGVFEYTALTSVVIPGGVTYLGSEAFFRSSLRSITLQEGVETIGARAFNDCDQLEYVILPTSLTTIESAAFENTSGFIIYYAGTSEQWSTIEIDSAMEGICKYNSNGPDEDDFESRNLTGEDEEPQEQIARGTCGLLIWVLYSDGTMIISGEGSMCEWGGYTLVSWANYRKDITSVILEDGVTSISDCAFYRCSNLTEVSIPASVTSIGQQAFDSCSSLTEIEIPDSVTSVGYRAFRGCGLTSVVIPASVTELGSEAFISCSKLTSVTVLAQVSEIKYRTFRNCTSLTSIALSKSITEISSEVFQNTSLTDIYYQGTEEEWNNVYIMYRTIATNFPQDVIVHYECEIGDTDVGADSNPGGTCGDNLTWTLDADGTLTISGSGDMTDWTETTAPTWYDWRESIVKVIIEDGVTSVGSFAFRNCPNLATVIVPSSVVQIGEGAFYNDIYQCNCATDLYYAGSEETWESDVSKGTNAFYRELSTYAVRFHYNSTGPEEGMERVISLSPYNGDTNVELGTYKDGKLSLVLTFDGEVALGEGLIQVCDYETGEVYRSVSAQDGDDNGNKVSLSVDGKTVTIEFTNAVLDTVSNAEDVQDCIPYDKTLCILIEENAIVFTDTGESFTIENPSSWQFTTEWGLTADVDLLSFHNSSFSFDCEHYTVSSEIQKWLISYALSEDDILARIDEKIYTDEWVGSCYGMCAVVALAYTGNLDLNAWNVGADRAGNCASITSPSGSKGEYGTLDLINYYHLLENIMDKNYVEKGLIFHKGWEETWSEIVSLASKLDSTKEPFILEIEMKDTIDDGEVGHSLLVTGYHMDNGNSVLETYDVSSDDYFAEIIINGDDVTLNSIAWGNGITVSGVAYTVVDELKKYNIDEFISSDDGMSALEDGDESDSASQLSAVEKSDDALITSVQYLTDSTQGTDSTLETASTQEVTSTQEMASTQEAAGTQEVTSIQETASAQETDYAKLYISAGGNFVVTNADGDTFSCTDGVFSVSMEVYDFYTVGYGSDYEYVIYTDPSTSFSYDTDNDSLSLTVYQDGIYTRAEAGEGTERITVVPGTSATVEATDAVEYMVHFSAESLGDTMIAVMGTSEGTVELDFTDVEQFQVVSAALKDTVIRYYDLNGTIPVDTAVDDSKSGILVDTAGGGAVSVVSETIDASSLFTLLFGFSRMQMIMIAGLGIAAVGLIVFGVLFAVRFLRRKK